MDQNTYLNKTVGEIVKGNYQTAEVFKKFNIDFCCGGKVKIDEACSANNIPIDELTNALVEAENYAGSDTEKKFKDWDPDFLANYIVNVHHKYVRDNIPLLSEFTQKIAHVHGERHPELIQIAELFQAVSSELQHHMMKEENILFPYIIEIQSAFKNKSQLGPSPFGTVKNPIRMMEMEHDNAGALLKQIRQLSDNYSLPEDACNTYMVTYKKLDEFENDLYEHIHLENNILFPKAIELEENLTG